MKQKSFKMLSIFLACLILLSAFSITAMAAPVQTFTVTPIVKTVRINGKDVAFNAYTNKNNTTYYSISELALALNGTSKQFDVKHGKEVEALLATVDTVTIAKDKVFTGQKQKNIPTESQKVPYIEVNRLVVDGKEHTGNFFYINGDCYTQINPIGAVLNFKVEWDEVNKYLVIDTTKKYVNSGVIPPDENYINKENIPAEWGSNYSQDPITGRWSRKATDTQWKYTDKDVEESIRTGIPLEGYEKVKRPDGTSYTFIKIDMDSPGPNAYGKGGGGKIIFS